MEKTITAIVPVKNNSSRLPGKNILPFGKSNLLLHKIEQLKQVDEITEKIEQMQNIGFESEKKIEQINSEINVANELSEPVYQRNFAGSVIHDRP